MTFVIRTLCEKGSQKDALDDSGKRPVDYMDFVNFDQELFECIQGDHQINQVQTPDFVSQKETESEKLNTLLSQYQTTSKTAKMANKIISDSSDVSDVVSFGYESESEVEEQAVKKMTRLGVPPLPSFQEVEVCAYL